MNLSDILRKVFVGRVIKISGDPPRGNLLSPFYIEDIYVDSGGCLVVLPEGESPIIYRNASEFHFTDETPRVVKESAPKDEEAPKKVRKSKED